MTNKCLIIANQHYDDPRFRELPGAAADAEALAEVLGNPSIGGFTVTVRPNQNLRNFRRHLQEFFKNAGREDLLLLHISCHGARNEEQRLVLVASDTEREVLDATGLDCTFLNDQIERCRSKQVIVFLDCCYSGAFNRGFQTRTGESDQVNVVEPLNGEGRIVITASTALQFAHEKDIVESRGLAQPSVFTSALVDGLRTGDADLDCDGYISIDELYEWVHDRVANTMPMQTPTRSVTSLTGTVYVARSAKDTSGRLPPLLRREARSNEAWQRIGAVHGLHRFVTGAVATDEETRAAATTLLTQLLNDLDADVVQVTRQALADADTTLTEVARQASAGFLPYSVVAARIEVDVAQVAATPLTAAQYPGAIADFRLALDDIVAGRSRDPHRILGLHATADGRTIIRAFRPEARSVTVLSGGGRQELTLMHPGGLFGAFVDTHPSDYRLEVTYGDVTVFANDPYRWLPSITDAEAKSLGDAPDLAAWQLLGATPRSYDTPSGHVDGTAFTLWAPNAQGVRVAGDFDYWTGAAHPMRCLGSSGVWELFIPDITVGARYRFDVLGRDGIWRQKADPAAKQTEPPPARWSVVAGSDYVWGDTDWMAERAAVTNLSDTAMSIYEVHLGSWRQGLTYDLLADQLVEYVTEAGFTHVELLPVTEYPLEESLGFQTTSYYAPTSRFGTPDQFRKLVDALHQAGVGVLVEWVPSQFPKDDWALAWFDGTPLFEHADPRRGERPSAGTLVFDYGRPEVRNFLIGSALYWFREFHLDGLQVTGVASMLYLDFDRADGGWAPNVHGGRENLEAYDFLQHLNGAIYRAIPGVTMIADDAGDFDGVTRPTHLSGLGFGFAMNVRWREETVSFVSRTPADRQSNHGQLAEPGLTMYAENYVLPLDHDLVGRRTLASRMPSNGGMTSEDADAYQLAMLRAFYGLVWAWPGKQLLFMGSEFADTAVWTGAGSLNWDLRRQQGHRVVLRLVAHLNRLYRDIPALSRNDTSPVGFWYLDANDAAASVFSFLRRGNGGDTLACVTNFATEDRIGYRVALPSAGPWEQVLDTATDGYSTPAPGSRMVIATADPWNGQPASRTLDLRALSTVWLTRTDPVPPRAPTAA